MLSIFHKDIMIDNLKEAIGCYLVSSLLYAQVVIGLVPSVAKE